MASHAPDVICTPRLLGRRIAPEHEPLFLMLHGDSRVVRWLGAEDEEVSAQENREWLEERSAHWNEHGFGLYALLEVDAPGRTIAHVGAEQGAGGTEAAGRFVGRAGLQRVDADVGKAVGDPGAVELMYALAYDAWGRGLATEIGERLISVARDDLGLKQIIADAVPHNERSRRVIERLGMDYQGEFWHDDHWMSWYRMAL